MYLCLYYIYIYTHTYIVIGPVQGLPADVLRPRHVQGLYIYIYI